jgi:dipeptidyl aminopeptidase/acylaminoacyl peptidase
VAQRQFSRKDKLFGDNGLLCESKSFWRQFMYFDADLHLATKRLILAYQDSTEARGLLIKDLSGSTIALIKNPYSDGPRWSPDGLKFAYFGNWQLYIHTGLDTEAARVIEMPNYQAAFCEWSPGSDALIFSAYASTHPLPPPNIYRYDLEDSSITQITHSADVDRFPKWNHTASQIACHRSYLDESENHTGIVIVHLNENREQVLPRPEGFSQRISRYSWSPDNQQLLLTEYRKGETRFVVYQIASGEVVWSKEDTNIVGACFEPYTGRVVCVTNASLSIYELPSQIAYAQLNLSDIAAIRATLSGPVIFFSPNEESVYFLGTDSRFYRWRIHHNCEVLIEPDIDKREMAYQRHDYSFRASDGYLIPVQQYIPAKPNGRAIFFVEGGPGAYIDADNAIAVRLLAEGYEVIRPAYRGCGGYGDEHYRANEGQCGQADVRDVVECGIDWRQRFKKPDAPLAVSGYSYGGYLTFLAMSHQDAVWTCGISFWGATAIPPLVQTKGLPVDSHERQKALEERSPIRQAHRIRFPLLILHGDHDTTALTEEVKIIYERVRASDILCDLIVFENEGHGLFACRPQMYSHALRFLEANME